MPHLSRPQLTGLVLWVCGTILAGSACQNAVAAALSTRGNWNNMRQYLREWLYDGGDRARPCGTELDVSLCFAPLLRWVLSWWRSDRLALAIDPTLKGSDQPSHSVVYRRRRANKPGAWMDPIRAAEGAGPGGAGLSNPDQSEIVGTDTRPGVASVHEVSPCAEGGRRLPARTFLSRPDTAWIGGGTAFSDATVKRRCTLIVVWYAEQEEPWIILTDHPPGEAGASWYALRFWIELGFKMLKSVGWQWQRTRRTSPERISRHWLVLSVTTLLALAYGTRVEDAFDRKIAPGSLRAPPKCLASTHLDSRSSAWSATASAG